MDDVVCGGAVAASGVTEDFGPEELLIEPEKKISIIFHNFFYFLTYAFHKTKSHVIKLLSK